MGSCLELTFVFLLVEWIGEWPVCWTEYRNDRATETGSLLSQSNRVEPKGIAQTCTESSRRARCYLASTFVGCWTEYRFDRAPETGSPAAPVEQSGAEGDRTLYLLHAMQALSQMSYGPCLQLGT